MARILNGGSSKGFGNRQHQSIFIVDFCGGTFQGQDHDCHGLAVGETEGELRLSSVAVSQESVGNEGFCREKIYLGMCNP